MLRPQPASDTRPCCRAQTYYKLSYVDRRVDNPEQRICEDIPALCDGLGDLLGEWCKCACGLIRPLTRVSCGQSLLHARLLIVQVPLVQEASLSMLRLAG